MDVTTPPQTDRLIVRHDLRVVRTVALDVDSLTIGRSGHCDVVLDHDAVSRYHARVERHEAAWHVVDNDSANGVLVNGRREREAPLKPGDVVEIRPFAMNYLGAGGDEAGSGDRSVHLSDSDLVPTIVRGPDQSTRDFKQRLEDLYLLSGLVIRRKDNGTFWQKIHGALGRSLSADRCVLVGVDPAAGLFRLAPNARGAECGSPLELSRSVLREVIESGRALLIRSVSRDEKFAEARSLAMSAVGSVICVPVIVAGQTRAVVYADRHHAAPPFEADDLDFVIAAVDLAATAVGMDELQAGARELSRVRGRIETAREMQEILLPHPIPQPSWGQVAGRNYPADQMSGDIYDVFIDAAGRLVLSVADVAGKGVPAAFVTAILQDSLRQSAAHLDDLGEIVQRINASMGRYSTTGCFATMVVCRWSASGDAVEIANAGHHAPLWVDASGKVEAFPERVGLILGFSETWEGRVVRRDARSDVAMLLSSDGATEAVDAEKREYGLSRLGQRLAALRDEDAEAIVAGLLDDVRQYCSPREPADDVTLLGVKRTP